MYYAVKTSRKEEIMAMHIDASMMDSDIIDIFIQYCLRNKRKYFRDEIPWRDQESWKLKRYMNSSIMVLEISDRAGNILDCVLLQSVSLN